DSQHVENGLVMTLTQNLPLLAGVMLALAIITFGYFLFKLADDKTEARKSLKLLEDYDNDLVNKLRKVRQRETHSAGSALVSAGKKLTPAGWREKTAHKLAIAGRPTKDDVDRYYAERILCLIVGVLLFLLIAFALPFFHGTTKYCIAIFLLVGIV